MYSVADDSRLRPDQTVEHATCLGCGCTCDDITVVVRSGRIAETHNACPVGVEWFGSGEVPTRIVARSSSVEIQEAVAQAADLLSAARRPLVYLAADLSCESQRAAIAIADILRGALDSITTATAGDGILAAQRRGHVTATLGEIRNRADAVVFWGVDPARRYPRYTSRYLPEPVGLYVSQGRAGRQVVAVDIDEDRGPSDADARVHFTSSEEVNALTLARAAVVGALTADTSHDSLEGRAVGLAHYLQNARYTAIVADGESGATSNPHRAESLLLLVEALNRSGRCVLSILRGGGNRSGADSVMTWQTGYPMAVDFFRGTPSYEPVRHAEALLESGEVDVAIVVGAPASVPSDVARTLSKGVSCIAIGPRASESPYPTTIAIDTGVAGIHERGTVVRMDEIPVPLRPALESDVPQKTVSVLRDLVAEIVRRGRPKGVPAMA